MNGISAINSTSPYLYGHIASGNRLMSAADGAAELAITKKMQAQTTGINTGTKNLSDGVSMVKTSDAALGSITNSLQRMRELAVRASSGLLNNSNRAAIQKEVDQIKQEIDHVATQTNFNGISLLDGSQSNGVGLVGDAGGSYINVNNTPSSTLEALGLKDFDVTGNFNIQDIDAALDKVSGSRSTLGAEYNKLEYGIDYNKISAENLTASESRMGDTDVAKALTELKHQQTLQSVTMMLQKKNMAQKGQQTLGILDM